MTDRRRINGPSGGTTSVTFINQSNHIDTPTRQRKPNELRRLFLRTGLTPTVNGSAYLEVETPNSNPTTFIPTSSTIKLSCSVHGPKPVQRNVSFSPNIQLNASIKFAPYATRQRRGYVRDNIERDLGSHLENALKGVVIPDRWPKSSIDIAVTVLEGEEDCLWTQSYGDTLGISGVGLLNVLAGCVTVATAALVNAGIDCLDLLTGGVAAISTTDGGEIIEILDPCPSEHENLSSACVVAYLPSRDEITEVWCKGDASGSLGGTESLEKLVDAAARSARGSYGILADLLRDSVTPGMNVQNARESNLNSTPMDVEMKS